MPYLCPCGTIATWRKHSLASPETAPEGAVCLLREADFAGEDDLCDACFRREVPEDERAEWRPRDEPETTHNLAARWVE